MKQANPERRLREERREESATRIILDAVREAPPRTRRVLMLNLASAIAATAITALDGTGGSPGGAVRLGAVVVGFVGIFLITLAYVLHHLSQNSAGACTRLSFYRLEYRELHGSLRALPTLAAAAAACLAIATAVYAFYSVEHPVLLVVAILFGANLALALRSVGRTSRFLYTHAREQAEAAERARAQAAEAQLAALQAQLDPHFLFNALNTVAGLVRSDAAAAEASVENLAEVLRRTLARSRRQWTTLREELDYLRAYLAIEQERWGERLEVSWRVDPETLDLSVPPMTLQPLVENSLKHGLGNRIEGGRIEICAARENGRLCLTVRDDGVGLRARSEDGMGLANLRERMRTLYGDGSRLTLDSDGGWTRAVVEIPFDRGRS